MNKYYKEFIMTEKKNKIHISKVFSSVEDELAT